MKHLHLFLMAALFCIPAFAWKSATIDATEENPIAQTYNTTQYSLVTSQAKKTGAIIMNRTGVEVCFDSLSTAATAPTLPSTQEVCVPANTDIFCGYSDHCPLGSVVYVRAKSVDGTSGYFRWVSW